MMKTDEQVRRQRLRTRFVLGQYAEIVSSGENDALAHYIARKFCELYALGPGIQESPANGIGISASSTDYSYFKMSMDPFRVFLNVSWRDDEVRLNATLEASSFISSLDGFQKMVLNSERKTQFSLMPEEEKLRWAHSHALKYLARLYIEGRRRDEVTSLARRMEAHAPDMLDRVREEMSFEFAKSEHVRMDKRGIPR